MSQYNNSDVDLISVPPTNLLIAALGNTHAAIVLQHLFWCYLHFGKKEFYRTLTAMSFGDETDGHIGTGLTVDKIRTAIKWLKKNRLISTRNKLTHHKPPPKLHFTLNFYEINQLFIERGYKSLISHYLVTLPNSIWEMSQIKSKNITNEEDLVLKESEFTIVNSPDSQNPPAENQNPGVETPSASNINITGLAAMPITSSSLDDLISALTSPTTTDESPKKKRKVVRQRKPREQRMIEAKRAPEEFNQDEKQFYEEGWVVHLSKRGCSAVQLEEHKSLWLKFKQENFNIVLMMRYYIAEGVYGVSEQRVRWDIEKGKHKVIPSQSTPDSNVVPISKKPPVSKIPRGYVIAN